MMKLHKYILLHTVLFFSLITGCIKEDMAYCDTDTQYSFNIDMVYKRYNKQDGSFDADNIIKERIGDISVLLYDSIGNYIKTVREVTGNLSYVEKKLRINVPVDAPGRYRYIVLGDTFGDDFVVNTGSLTKSGSDLDNFSVEAATYAGKLSREFVEKAYIATEASVLVGEDVTTATAELFCNNNQIEISISGVKKSADDYIELSFSDDNLSFNKENTPSGNVPYIPYFAHEQPETDVLELVHHYKFETMRLMHSKPLILTINVFDKDGVSHTVHNIDIMGDVIKKARDNFGRLLYDDQLDLDYQDSYDMSLIFKEDPLTGKVTLEIRVHDWLVVDVIPETI